MKFKGEMQIGKFCETERKSSDPIQEESIVLSFKAKKPEDLGDEFDHPCLLVGMTPGDISALVGEHEKAGITVSGITGQKSGVYNITINDYQFIGNTFTSFEIKRVKKVGSIIILLRLKLKYDKKFHEQYPRFIRDVLDIEITEVNEQMTIPEPGEEETPDQDSQPKKTGKNYSLGRTCESPEGCEEPIRNDSKTGLCKEHR